MPLKKDTEFREQLPKELKIVAAVRKKELDELYDGDYVDRVTMEKFTDGLKEYYLDLAEENQ